MSRRRKHLTQQELVPPSELQQIVRAGHARGSNIFEAETADGRNLLCYLPAKFNKKLWIKRGGYLIVEEGDSDADDKVTATIVKVLYEQDVKDLKKLPGVWPAGLNKQEEQSKAAISANVPFVGNSDESSSEDDLPPLFQNNNRQVIYRHEHEDSASDAEQ